MPENEKWSSQAGSKIYHKYHCQSVPVSDSKRKILQNMYIDNNRECFIGFRNSLDSGASKNIIRRGFNIYIYKRRNILYIRKLNYIYRYVKVLKFYIQLEKSIF